MNYKYDFTVVLFADEEESLKASYESIQKQTYEKEKIQLIVVMLSMALEKSAVISEIQKTPHEMAIEAWKDEDITEAVRGQIQGAYVTFLKAGITYHGQAFANISRRGKEKSADVVFGALKNLEKIKGVQQEYVIYCKRNHRHVSLEEDCRLLHNMYFAYFLKSEKLDWNTGIHSRYWIIGVLLLVCGGVLRSRSIACEKEICVYTPSGEETICDWNDLFKRAEGRDVISGTLLKHLVEIVTDGETLHRSNGEYVLVYYCYSMLMERKSVEPAVDRENIRAVEKALEAVENKDVIVHNRYLPQIYKHAIIEKYFPQFMTDTAEEIQFILQPQFKEMRIRFFEIKKDRLHIELSLLMPVNKTYEVYMNTGKEEIPVPMTFEYDHATWGEENIGIYGMYDVTVPLAALGNKIRWKIGVNGDKVIAKNLFFSRYTPFTLRADLFYEWEDRLYYLSREKNAICVRRNTWFRRLPLALKRTFSLIKGGKAGIKAVVARMMYGQRKRKQEKDIWLISDRTNRGDDNGEVVFRYLQEHPIANVEPCFVVDKDTPDWAELKKIGKVVAPFSREHKILFLLNSLSLSSQANKAVINPFGKLEVYYRDLMFDKKLVFLQHGITKDNQSAWLNKYNRNLSGIVVTTKPEYDSMLEYDYYYTPDRIWLTGMPRYDRLYHDEKKYITIMPTWRKSLSPGTDENGVWLISDDFPQSEYFRFYNTLLNDKVLIQAAKQYGYTICFMPHPNTISALHMFKKHEEVQFFDMKKSYRDVFAQTDLMVTDYSSVAFDFAYLRKPIVYSQFDREDFFSGSHSYTEGYFDYETDGFGEVEYTLEGVRERLISYMSEGCRLKPEYEARINQTFAFNDKNCCKRLCEKIEELL